MLRTNGVTAPIAMMLALGASSGVVGQNRAFAFAGLSLNTTMAELKQRYPRSTFLDTVVYVSEQESHDSISTIGLSHDGPIRAIAITFERQRGNRTTYPSCEKLVAVITNQYGRPANVIDAQEEQARNRRFEWKTSAESLAVSCFRLPPQPFYAERVTIASSS